MLTMQALQCMGQSIELAIKGYILACGVRPERGHNLVEFAKLAEKQGMKFERIEESAIVLVNHYYFQDLVTTTRYKSRYPTSSTETFGGPIPDVETVKNIFSKLIQAANEKCPQINLYDYVKIT